MLKNILDSVESWEGFKTWTDPIQLRWKLQDIKVKYTDDTQIEDDIGVQSEEQADIVEEIEGEKEDSCTKRKLSSWSADRTVKRLTKIAMYWIQIVVLSMQMLLKIRRI